jgi:hypothetical protein
MRAIQPSIRVIESMLLITHRTESIRTQRSYAEQFFNCKLSRMEKPDLFIVHYAGFVNAAIKTLHVHWTQLRTSTIWWHRLRVASCWAIKLRASYAAIMQKPKDMLPFFYLKRYLCLPVVTACVLIWFFADSSLVFFDRFDGGVCTFP